jgi:hypothetical protein
MIIISHNILAAPLVGAVWAIDLCLCLAALRLVLGSLPCIAGTTFVRTLCELIDPLAHKVQRYLPNRRGRRVPGWAPWQQGVPSGRL